MSLFIGRSRSARRAAALGSGVRERGTGDGSDHSPPPQERRAVASVRPLAVPESTRETITGGGTAGYPRGPFRIRRAAVGVAQ